MTFGPRVKPVAALWFSQISHVPGLGRTEAMTSRTAQLAVIDTIIAALTLADYDRAVATIDRIFHVL